MLSYESYRGAALLYLYRVEPSPEHDLLDLRNLAVYLRDPSVVLAGDKAAEALLISSGLVGVRVGSGQ